MRALFSLIDGSALSIRTKLFIPVGVQVVIVMLVSGILLNGYLTVMESRDREASTGELLNHLFNLGVDIESFINGESSLDSINEKSVMVKQELAEKGEAELSARLSELEVALGRYDQLREEKNSLLNGVREVTSSSRALSNAYIVEVSGRLADTDLRFDVTTIERAVIRGALQNTINNFSIEDMFLLLDRGDKTPEQALALLDGTIANTTNSIKLLQGTPFVGKAEAGLRVNKQLRETLLVYLELLEQERQARQSAVKQHTALMESVLALSSNSLLTTLDRLTMGIWTLLAVFIVTVGISLISSILVSVSVIRPMKQLRRHIDSLAESGGDLSYRLDASRKDEIGMLASGVNHFLQTLQEIFSEVKRVGERLSVSSHSVAEVTSRCSGRMNEQQGKVRGVVDSTGKIKGIVERATHESESAAVAVERSESRVVEVVDSIRKTIAVVKEANIELENACIVINRLAEDSQNIGGILEVIRSIADQTNLLALNAAIEAARAGDQGRGFAVVADEVRSLAQRTQTSTKEIDKMISSLQGASSLATGVLSSTTSNISATLDSSQMAGDGVRVISDCISEIKQINTDIAEMMENQLSKVHSIDGAVREIGEISDSNTHAVNQASNTAEQQALEAETLSALIQRFKV